MRVRPDRPTVGVISSTSVRIEWNAITTGMVVTHYIIQYRNQDEQNADWMEVAGTIRNVTGIAYMVDDLKPGMFSLPCQL